MEHWKDYMDGYYQVSNFGNVRRAKDGVNTKTGRSKSLCVNSAGYKIFGANINGIRKNVYVHRAVVECFVGEITSGFVVNHKDGNKLNNHIDNLEIVTISQNGKHATEFGLNEIPTARAMGDNHWTRKHPDKVKRGNENGAALHPEKIHRGEQCRSSKLTAEIVSEIKSLATSPSKDVELAEKFGVTRENVSAIRRGKSWKHVVPAL